MSSDEDGAELMAAFKRNGARKSAQPPTNAPSSTVAGDSTSEPTPTPEDRIESHDPPIPRRALCVRVKPVDNESEYVYYEPTEEVEEVIREFSRKGEVLYDVRLLGGVTKQVSAHGKGSVRSISLK
jgi:hypothetical protein